MKRDLKYYLVLTSCLLALILVEVLTPPAIDWSPSFSARDKIPYGSHILFELLPHLFPPTGIEVLDQSIFTVLKEHSFERTNYVFINSAISVDEVETRALLDFVDAGNHVFIAAQQFKGGLEGTLKIDTSRDFLRTDSLGIHLANTSVQNESYRYKPGTVAHYFTSFDTSKTTILGFNDRDQVNFIKVRWGQGVLWLSCIPLAFTNYNLLAGPNADYVFNALSYLPLQHTLWDEYYKVRRLEARLPMRYILKRAPLKWAFYLALVLLVLFIAFEGRRKQRAIPLIEPLPNRTLEFVETVGRLYYQQRDHKNIAAKKIKYFLEHLRTHLGLKVQNLADAGRARVAAKTGAPAAAINELFDCLQQVQNADVVREDELARLNRLLERFYTQEEARDT